MKTGRRGKIVAFTAAAVMILAGLFQAAQTAYGAVFDEGQAVSYGTYAASHTIEDSTLFIGTYLIHSQALTEELYERALDSASESNQMNVYYKSELAGGAWFDITSASGIVDITSQGTVVEESELSGLWVTCYTGSDGVTKKARDDSVVNIFDNPDPYDLYEMPELEPLRIQYDNVYSSKSEGVERFYYRHLQEFFRLDLRNDVTAACDEQLKGLQSCYQALMGADKKELAEIVSRLMGKIDARRRAEIFWQLSGMENNLLTNLQQICSGAYEKIFDEGQAVSYETYAASHTIAPSTLLVGANLIHSQALSDESYRAAAASASLSGQRKVYYKLDLAELPKLFNLSELLKTSDQLAKLKELKALEEKEGALQTGETLPEEEQQKLDELKSWKNALTLEEQQTLSELEGKSLSEQLEQQERSELLGLFQKLEISDLSELKSLKGEVWFDISGASNPMDVKDSSKLANMILDGTPVEESKLTDLWVMYTTGSNDVSRTAKDDSIVDLYDLLNPYYEEELYDNEQFVTNADVIDALGSSIQNCQDSYITYSGKMLEESEEVLKGAEYEKSMEVINTSSGGYSSQVETLLGELNDLYHIEDDIVANADSELALLDGGLINKADSRYRSVLSAGADSAYQAAVASGISLAAREQALEDQKTKVNAVRSELQYLIQAKVKRQASSAASDYIYEKIDAASGFSGAIADDDFKNKAQESVDGYILWLQDLARSVADKDASGDEMQQLEARKEELLMYKAEALDENDLSAAKKYDAMIAVVDNQIETLEQELNAVLNSSGTSAAEKTRAAVQAGRSTTLNNINQMKNAALQAIADGNISGNEGLDNHISALAALGAQSALQEIRDKAQGSDSSSLLKKLDQAIEDSRESSLHGAYGGTGSGSGTGTGGSGGSSLGDGAGTGSGSGSLGGSAALAEAELEALIQDTFGDDFDSLSNADQASAIAGLNRLGQEGSGQASDMARAYLNRGVQAGNPYLYLKLKGEPAEYAPLKLIGDAANYRYVYSDSRKEVTLTRKTAIYRFTVASDQVYFRDGTGESLSATVKTQEVPYLSAEDTKELFGCIAEYIENTDYGVLLSPKMEKGAEGFVLAAQEGEE